MCASSLTLLCFCTVICCYFEMFNCVSIDMIHFATFCKLSDICCIGNWSLFQNIHDVNCDFVNITGTCVHSILKSHESQKLINLFRHISTHWMCSCRVVQLHIITRQVAYSSKWGDITGNIDSMFPKNNCCVEKQAKHMLHVTWYKLPSEHKRDITLEMRHKIWND